MSVEPRRLKSGRTTYDVRLRTPDGRQYKRSFRTRKEAETFEARELADRSRGAWVDPRAAQILLVEYATAWVANRPIRPRTRETYEDLLRIHIIPTLGQLPLSKLAPSGIRTWHAELLRGKYPGAITTAKAYRLLRAILNTALEDGLLVKNPCLIEGAGVEHSAERPIATVPEVYALAGAVEARYRSMVLLAVFAGLRLGELLSLRRRHIDVENESVRVEEQAQELRAGTRIIGPPKSEAGKRTVALPPQLVPELEAHIERWTTDDPDDLLFTDEDGEPLTRRLWNLRWAVARKQAGLEHLHFHDLRHTGNTIAAATGASTKELMARMGHSSALAALIYQHATRDRDVAIAHAIGDIIDAADVVTEPDADRMCHESAIAGRVDELKAARERRDQRLRESGRRESNSRSQLGKLMFCL
jgi:integrase